MIASGPDSDDAGDRALPQAVVPRADESARPMPGLPRLPLIVAAIVAGLIAVAGGEAANEIIPPEKVHIHAIGGDVEVDSRETPKVVTQTSAVAFGALGLSLGLLFGISGGLSRRPIRAGRMALASGVGGLLGAGLGVSVALGLVPIVMDARLRYSDPPIWYGIVHHLTAAAPLGLIAGLAFSIGLGDRRMVLRAALAAMGGAIAGSVASDILGAIAFPLARTDSPLAETMTSRFTARLLVTIGTAAALLATPLPEEPTSS